MSYTAKRVAELSPEEQRALLGQLLEKKASQPKIFPLSFAQERLWFLSQFVPDSPVYNVPFAFRLTGQLNVEVLEQSINEIIKRHDILRTTFVRQDEGPVQFVSPTLTVPLSVEELREFPETEREKEALRRANEVARLPFELAKGPLIRPTLIRLSETEQIFLLTIHHAISEIWSFAVFFEELEQLYEAFLVGKPSPLADLPIQYADFVRWQRQWLKGDALENQLAYWKQQLGGALPVLEFPTDHPRPATQTFRGAWRSLVLPRAVSKGLKSLSQQEGVTLFMTLLAAFKTLLYRYTGQEDIIVGTPIGSRPRAETEKLIGLFINTLVLRTNISGEPRFRTLLERVCNVCLDAFTHQEMPFEKLVETLRPDRDINHTPLFQVLFAHQNTPPLILQLSGMAPGQPLRALAIHNGSAKFDLALITEETEEGVVASFEYSTDLFEASTIERMLKHFQILLEGIVAHPDQRLSQLPILTESERHQLLYQWNKTQSDYPKTKCLHHLFEEQVARTPHAVAVVFENQQITYDQLNRRANQLAHYLQSLGVGPEVLVGLCVERSVEMMVGLLGILKAGGAYVPLDSDNPKERLAFMVEDAQVAVLLTQQKLVAQLPDNQTKVMCLDTDWEVVSGQPTENPQSGIQTKNLAYVIYTSGSTGQPKSAMNPHRGIVNRLLWMQDRYQLTEADRVVQKTPMSFDVSGWEFFWPLIVGARQVIARPEGHKDNAYLVELIASQKITTIHFVPSMFQLFLKEKQLDRCRCLKRIICSGEALTLDLQQRCLTLLDAELHNLYGPAEASIDVTFWECKPETDQLMVPIGCPIANTQIYLLDVHLNPVPVGVAGELHIGGDGVGRGYLHRPELTAEKFIPDPFSSESGARLYKTGDLARYRPDGVIEFIGRIDYQVKIRGVRVELGEIEATLSQHPTIVEVVVVDCEDQPGDKYLVAYLVSNQKQPPTISQLRRFILEKLPDYMVPSVFMFVDALPLNPNGKVDRKALPAPEGLRPKLEAAYVAPRTEIERVVAKVWAEVLRIEQVGSHDNFFDLGGHSLRLVQVHGKLQELLNREIPIVDMFKYPTVSALAKCLSSKPGARGEVTSLGSVEKLNEDKKRLKQLFQQRQLPPKK